MALVINDAIDADQCRALETSDTLKSNVVIRESIRDNVKSVIDYPAPDVRLHVLSSEEKQHKTSSIVITVAETVSDDETDEEIHPVVQDSSFADGLITRSFSESESQWIEEPVMRQWRKPSSKIRSTLCELDALHRLWSQSSVPPFNQCSDRLWMETADVLRDVGLPWHNNEINAPNQIDTSWPFHFKSFEKQVMAIKGSRVGDKNADGYVAGWSEANLYCIRALQQELRIQIPYQRPLLITENLEIEIAESAVTLFGLQWLRIDTQADTTDEVLSLVGKESCYGKRPIIFAATLANWSGIGDNISLIEALSRNFKLVLHLDATRNFDYLTTMSSERQNTLGISDIRLEAPCLNKSIVRDGLIHASTIVAGGMNALYPPSVVALKPKSVGSSTAIEVEYVKATDDTLAGSRDALSPLLCCLQELRFTPDRLRGIYERCRQNMQSVIESFQAAGINYHRNLSSFDILVEPAGLIVDTIGLEALGVFQSPNGSFLVTIQPSVDATHIKRLLSCFSMAPVTDNITHELVPIRTLTRSFKVPYDIVYTLSCTIKQWKVITRSSAGYPFNMASYSSLGPMISHFLSVNMPSEWIKAQSAKLLDNRKGSFGLKSLEERDNFKGTFTTGSTMGNRVGIHAALAAFPSAFLYFSSQAHYSVKKTARDSDLLSNRWGSFKTPTARYAEIAADSLGRMIPTKLVEEVIKHRKMCQAHGEKFEMVLFANMGTTFVGGCDNILEIQRQLAKIDVQIAYIHVDGALDFGFPTSSIRLGRPGALTVNSDCPIVQGVTLSHHKAFGTMVSGEVISYSPQACWKQEVLFDLSVDPRAVFETWLFEKFYSPQDLATLHQYCVDNAAYLRKCLKHAGTITRANEDSAITVLERIPAWIVEDYSLRPEGDWVHFITMPHISPSTVDTFVRSIIAVDMHCNTAFDYVASSLNATIGQPLALVRISCVSELADQLSRLTVNTMGRSNISELGSKINLDDLHARYLRGAICIAAVDVQNMPQVVFLAESTSDRAITPGPVLVLEGRFQKRKMIRDVAEQLFGHIARLLTATLRTDSASFEIISL